MGLSTELVLIMFSNTKFYIINRSLDHLHIIDVETVVRDDGSAFKQSNQPSALCIFIFFRLYRIRASKSTNTLAIMNLGHSSYRFIQYGGQQAAQRFFGMQSREANHFDSPLVMGCIPGHKSNPSAPNRCCLWQAVQHGAQARTESSEQPSSSLR